MIALTSLLGELGLQALQFLGEHRSIDAGDRVMHLLLKAHVVHVSTGADCAHLGTADVVLDLRHVDPTLVCSSPIENITKSPILLNDGPYSCSTRLEEFKDTQQSS